MDNNEVENDKQKSEGLDKGKVGIAAGFLGVLFGLLMAIKAWITSRALKKEQEKSALFQEVIRRHQAEINALKNYKEREEYKNRLWEELKTKSEE